MAGETSDPGGQDTIDQAEEENMIAKMSDAESQASMSEAGLSMGFGDFAGSTALANRQGSSLTGSILTDALIPGVGTLNVVNALSASQTQSALQRGASPVYGSSGNVIGATDRSGRYTGDLRGDPNPPSGGDDSEQLEPVRRRTTSGRPGQPVKGVSNTTARRITPKSAVRGASLAPKLYAMSSRGRGRGINTSSQGILGSAPVQKKTLLGT